uniref:Sel1 repeat family protein n=1 Tax=Micromonas pusilla TaxID=38833 RepID=A0A7R9TCL0_MICPS
MRAEALFWFVKAAGRIEYARPTSRDDALTLGRRLACREASDASVDAAYRAGVCYDRGLGTAVDVTRAAEMYRRACAGLHYDAMCALGVLLLMKTRDDDAESHREATRWLREVADATGNDQAEVHMGIAYATGKGVEKDVERARAWYARAESAYDDAAMALREAGDRAWNERVHAARFEGDAPT